MSDHAKRISPVELDEMQRFGSVTLLDMRRDWDTADTRIPGAVRVDPDGYEEYVGSLPAGKPVVTYCT